MRSSLIAFSVLLLLASVTFATDVNANFQGKSPEKDFNTTLRLTTSFNISAAALNGSALSVQSGGTVCGGETVTVNATVGATWGVTGIAIASLYPACSGIAGEYCPAMIPAGTTSANNPIAWLAPATYSTEAGFASTNGFTQDPSHRNALGGVFYNEPATYNNGTVQTPSIHPGMQGGANVFCEGTFEVRDNGVVKVTSPLPSASNAQFVITATNTTTHTLTTDLSGVACFATLEKHPLDNVNNVNFYRLYYFGRNLPVVPSQSATSTITINVINSGGTCTMHSTAISVSRSAAANGTTMIKTTVHNDADAIHVLSVASSDAQFTVIPFPVNLGGLLGFGTLSPTSNGFNETINPGANKDLYVLVTTSAASGTPMITYNAETISAACGASSFCSASVFNNTPTPAITCVIAPPSLTLANNVTNGTVTSAEVGQYNVACQDLAGATVPCTGASWTPSANILGTVISADNTQAQVYSNAIPPVSGRITYTDSGQIAVCNASLDIVTPNTIINSGNTTMSCIFQPPNANMAMGAVQYFGLNCFLNGTIPAAADSAVYDMINGLGGTVSNNTVNGVTYAASYYPATGDLRGTASYNIRSNVIGAVALAPITVNGTAPGAPYNCSIQPAYSELGQNEFGEFDVTCMDSAGNTVGCVGNAWAWSNISGGFIAPQTDNTHAWAYPDASVPIGTFGLLTYTSGQAMCNSTVKVVPNITACGFTPPGANLKANDTQYFTLNASVNGTPTIPTDAVYDLIDGLGGNHVNDSVAGTLYQAPADNTSGLLQGAAELNTGSPFVKGAVCFAPVTVGSGIPPNNGTGGDNGKSQWCTIFPSTSAFFPGEVVEVTVWCGKDANETCSYLNWNLQGAQIVPSGTGTYLNITTSSGLTGTITAIVSQDNKESCTFSYTAGNNTCASLS